MRLPEEKGLSSDDDDGQRSKHIVSVCFGSCSSCPCLTCYSCTLLHGFSSTIPCMQDQMMILTPKILTLETMKLMIQVKHLCYSHVMSAMSVVWHCLYLSQT